MSGSDRSPSTIVSFADIERYGAKDPVKAKFQVGYNTGVRHARHGQPVLDGVSRASRSVPFLAGYDAARIDYRLYRMDSSDEVTPRMHEAYRVYLSTHHGADMSWDSTLAARK